jgi:hypothetical protein
MDIALSGCNAGQYAGNLPVQDVQDSPTQPYDWDSVDNDKNPRNWPAWRRWTSLVIWGFMEFMTLVFSTLRENLSPQLTRVEAFGIVDAGSRCAFSS